MPKKADNFKGMEEEKLKKELASLEEKVRLIRFKSEGSKSKNVKESATLRKQIARLLTEFNKNNRKNNK